MAVSAGYGALFTLTLAVATSAASQDWPPLPPARPPEFAVPKPADAPAAPPAPQAATPPAASAPAPAPAAIPSTASQPSAESCLADLKAQGVAAEAAPAPAASVGGCFIDAPVRLTAIGLSGGGKIDLPAHPLLDCPFAVAFSGFIRDLAAPLAETTLGSPIAALDTGPGYDCRSVDHIPGAKISPHGKGVAIDVAAFLLADKRRLSVGHDAGPKEALYMRTIRRGGCGWFTTILGPGDKDHAEHFHFDILRHGSSDNYRICQ